MTKGVVEPSDISIIFDKPGHRWSSAEYNRVVNWLNKMRLRYLRIHALHHLGYKATTEDAEDTWQDYVEGKYIEEKNSKILLSIDVESQDDLDDNNISHKLLQEFEKSGVPVSGEASVWIRQKGICWLIVDGRHIYSVRRENGRLYIYSKKKESLDGVINGYDPTKGLRFMDFLLLCFKRFCWQKGAALRNEPWMAQDENEQGEFIELGFENDSHSPEVVAMQNEKLSAIQDCLNKLPLKYREIFVMYYLEGKAIREIAAELGVSEDTIKVHLYRARQKMRECLERKGAIL